MRYTSKSPLYPAGMRKPGGDSSSGRAMARGIPSYAPDDAGRLSRVSPVKPDMMEESLMVEADPECADEDEAGKFLHRRIEWCAPTGGNISRRQDGKILVGRDLRRRHLWTVSTLLSRRGAEPSIEREAAS